MIIRGNKVKFETKEEYEKYGLTNREWELRDSTYQKAEHGYFPLIVSVIALVCSTTGLICQILMWQKK